MENLTIGQIYSAIALIGGFITAITGINAFARKGFRKVIQEELNPIKEELEISTICALKNFIVKCLDDIDKGRELGIASKERLCEALDLYFNKYHQNSYIHNRVDKLRSEGKL